MTSKTYRYACVALVAIFTLTGITQAEITHRYQGVGNRVVDTVGAAKPIFNDGTSPLVSAEVPTGAPAGGSIRFGKTKDGKFSGFYLPPGIFKSKQGAVSMWIKADSQPDAGGQTFLILTVPLETGLNIVIQNGPIVLVRMDSQPLPVQTITLKTWTQITVVWNFTGSEKAVQFYADGELVASQPLPDGVLDAQGINIGSFSADPATPGYVASRFDGLIYDFQIYNTSLTSNQVTQLFKNPGKTADELSK